MKHHIGDSMVLLMDAHDVILWMHKSGCIMANVHVACTPDGVSESALMRIVVKKKNLSRFNSG